MRSTPSPPLSLPGAACDFTVRPSHHQFFHRWAVSRAYHGQIEAGGEEFAPQPLELTGLYSRCLERAVSVESYRVVYDSTL